MPHPFPTSHHAPASDKQIHRHPLLSTVVEAYSHLQYDRFSPHIHTPRTAFQVTTGNKTWFVKAADEDREENLTNWVAAIRGTIARLKQETSSPAVLRLPEFTHHSIGGRDFVIDSRYAELKYVFTFVY